MIAKELISTSIVPLKTSDTGSYALNIMEEIKDPKILNRENPIIIKIIKTF